MTQTPHVHREHGVERPDPYAWMAAGGDALLDHLATERAAYDAATARLRPLAETLRAEMVARVPASEISPRWARARYSYALRTRAGAEYADLVRAPAEGGPDEVALDVVALAADAAYLELGVTVVSPDEDLLAYSVDLDGDEVYELRFRDLRTGLDLEEVVPRSYYSGAWSADSAWFFYTVHDDAYRPHQVWRHRVGTPVAGDVLVLEEPDERFEVQVRGTRTGDLVVLWSESNTTSECWVVDARDVTRGPWSVGGRRDGVRYHAEHRRLPDGSSDLLVVTDDDAVESRLMVAPVPDDDQDATSWIEARPESRSQHLLRADAFSSCVLLAVREDGEHRLVQVPHDDLAGTRGSTELEGDLLRSPRYDAAAVTVLQESWLRPGVAVSDDLGSGLLDRVWEEEAPGYDASAYLTERRSFPSADGTAVPATILRHRDTPLDGTAPALVYGYGSYGAVDEPAWDPALPSLLDRGVVYVYAHNRGGGELGQRWYLDGKLSHKQHTFDDHVAVADGLARDGLVDPDRIATRGLSAGGLLQGAVFSQRPDRWRAVVAEVPFVDVVTTMFDASIPLTITEWDEWGDPRRRADFDWMLAYSPYDNPPPAGSRPDLLVTGAVHDPRVMVHEPAKWVARLRETDPEWSPRCLFRVETGAGAHTGPSGRFGHLAYEAEVYAWVLDRLGVS
ncbi:prolyl oligopeptidase family serine peptidase [Nocardioides mangrovi]|uniref:Prolyl oligopeptidase family serine peptidase n=1 Tax=Nocardioides mangrovi TaxID=2874580 RepID=A0ABS7UCW6_9ACTN|nr:prolyl oligopeptidase family serine peptidase [Nocardioides mangrovi]MBZ5738689.1 prolyl oligopeptidase family serine peptidase [Nocardioides mangrovi]